MKLTGEKSGVIRPQTTQAPPSARRLPIAEEHVRFAAFGIFQARQLAGAPGDSISDWLQAEHQLGERQPPQRR